MLKDLDLKAHAGGMVDLRPLEEGNWNWDPFMVPGPLKDLTRSERRN